MRATRGRRESRRMMSHSKVLMRITVMYRLLCELNQEPHALQVQPVISHQLLTFKLFHFRNRAQGCSFFLFFFLYLFTKFSKKLARASALRSKCCCRKKITGNALMIFLLVIVQQSGQWMSIIYIYVTPEGTLSPSIYFLVSCILLDSPVVTIL